MRDVKTEVIKGIQDKMNKLGFIYMTEYVDSLTFVNKENKSIEVPLVMHSESKPHMKLSLDAGTPIEVACHNDLNKKKCDNCMGCFEVPCPGIHCLPPKFINGEKVKEKECTCQRTQCLCLGRL